jgi:mannosyltransferase OCH1-like enzyme
MIPKIIWQTYEIPYDQLSDRIKKHTNSWITLNPEHEYKYFDASARQAFVLDNFGQEWHDLFVSLPLGVMRADIWRCMVVYVYGGVYSDIDTMCYAPINSWIPDDTTFAIFPENFTSGVPKYGENYATYMIASVPKNKILKNIIEFMFERLQNPDYSYEHFVHHLTGPSMVTQVILDTLKEDPQNGFVVLENIDTYKHKSMDHIYASQKWSDDHISWTEESARIVKIEKRDRENNR